MKLRYIVDLNLGTVESWYRQGVIDQKTFDRYCFVWAWTNGGNSIFAGMLEPYYRTKGREAFWNRIDRTKRRVELLRKGV